MKGKIPQICCKSDINYNDIDNEIARLEMKRQSVETECNILCNKLQGCLDNKNLDQKEYDRISREFGRSQDRLFYLNEKIIRCQMVKDGSVPLPKPRTDRSWSEDPFFDRSQHLDSCRLCQIRLPRKPPPFLELGLASRLNRKPQPRIQQEQLPKLTLRPGGFPM